MLTWLSKKTSTLSLHLHRKKGGACFYFVFFHFTSKREIRGLVGVEGELHTGLLWWTADDGPFVWPSFLTRLVLGHISKDMWGNDAFCVTSWFYAGRRRGAAAVIEFGAVGWASGAAVMHSGCWSGEVEPVLGRVPLPVPCRDAWHGACGSLAQCREVEWLAVQAQINGMCEMATFECMVGKTILIQ